MINCRISNGDKKTHQCVLTVEWEFRQKPSSLVTCYGLGWVRWGPINVIRTKSQLYLLSPGSQILCNNLKNVLLTKTLELVFWLRTNSSRVRPDLCVFNSLVLTLDHCLSVVSKMPGLVSSCVHLIWQFDIDPLSPDLTTQLSCHGRIQIRKMSKCSLYFYLQKYLIQWDSFMCKRLIWNTWRVFRKMINTCGV